MAKLNERISTLKAKLQALEAEQKAQERAAKQAGRQRARKAENHRKYELGGLVQLAGLFDLDRGALLGALLTLRPLLSEPSQFAEFKRAGDALLERREREKNLAGYGDMPDAIRLQLRPYTSGDEPTASVSARLNETGG